MIEAVDNPLKDARGFKRQPQYLTGAAAALAELQGSCLLLLEKLRQHNDLPRVTHGAWDRNNPGSSFLALTS